MVPALKLLKERCKQWSKDDVGNTYNQIKELELEANSLDHKKKKYKDLSVIDLIRRNNIASRLKTLYRVQKSS